MSEIGIRIATLDDAETLLNIYTPYVLETAATFECVPPTLEEFSQRVGSYLSKYPYLVAVDHSNNDEVIGFTYAGPLKQRHAYDWAVETSIYIKKGMNGKGVGRKLYETLEYILRKQGYTNMNAAVAYPIEEDEYLTRNSLLFHERMGFKYIGHFTKCGHKFGRWYDMSWMEKHIGEHKEDQPKVISFPRIRHELGTDDITLG